MQLLFGHDAAVLQWANQFFERPLSHPNWAIGAIDEGGVLQSALIGFEHSDEAVEVALCSTGMAITPEIVKHAFAVLFTKYWRIEAKTTKDNRNVKRALPKWGFSFEGTAKDYWGPGRSALCYRMLKPDCRWIKEDGQVTEKRCAG